MSTATENLEIVPNELCARQPLQVIHGLGRTFQRTRFLVYEYCLKLMPRREVERRFNELRTLSRKICSVEGRERPEESIEAFREEFWTVVSSEWWHEGAFERNDELIRTNDSDSAIHDAYLAVVAPIEDILVSLKKCLFTSLDYQGECAFEIGRLSELLRCRAEIERAIRAESLPTRAEGENRCLAVFRYHSVLQFGSDPFRVLDSWHDDVCAWWRELGLAEVPPTSLPDVQPNEDLADAVICFVEDLDAAFHSGVTLRSAPLSETPNSSPPGHFGLGLDHRARIVRREGFTSRSRTFTPLEFAVIERFVDRRTDGLSRENLEAIWLKYDEDTPSRTAVTTLVHELREHLKPIGIGITDGRGAKLRRLCELASNLPPD